MIQSSPFPWRITFNTLSSQLKSQWKARKAEYWLQREWLTCKWLARPLQSNAFSTTGVFCLGVKDYHCIKRTDQQSNKPTNQQTTINIWSAIQQYTVVPTLSSSASLIMIKQKKMDVNSQFIGERWSSDASRAMGLFCHFFFLSCFFFFSLLTLLFFWMLSMWLCSRHRERDVELGGEWWSSLMVCCNWCCFSLYQS